ncbi:MAG: UDP-N-acetylmuramoyl-L-alanine--D-glutamate ligase [Oscillospiraceae bacterium]|nr:UDP-N-acetylmuramoyl-L-alanine--D-glutamate ligase [Oscillospiraceae bacterium]
MTDRINGFFSGIKDKRIAFVGFGESHNRLIELMAKKGFDITVCDRLRRDAIGSICDSFERLGVRLCLGENYLDCLDYADIIFRTPGMYYHSPALSKARKAGKTVTSETEVFFDLCPCPIYAVTGSDGKTTTATLIYEILTAAGKRAHIGGNIGKALLCDIESIGSDDIVVAELSSFQLISMRSSPHVAVVTNISPNHLDVHKDMDEYTEAKRNILLHQNAFSRTVLNEDNETAFGLKKYVRGELVTFSRKSVPSSGAYLNDEGYICVVTGGSETKILHCDEIRLPGKHNAENYLAAISAVWPSVGIDAIRKVALEFGGVEHRLEFVDEIDGVKWYNDSKATTPTGTIACLDSFNRKIILIAGGYDKKTSYDPLAPKIIENVKTLVLIGQTAQAIEKAVVDCEGYRHNLIKILHANSMGEAVKLARSEAQDGDIAVLSPASASFGMFTNFAHRGEVYKEIVKNLKEQI